MAILVGESEASVARIAFTLGEEVISVNGPIELDSVLASHPQEDLVLIGPEVSLETAAAIAQKYRVSRPSLGVVLQRARIDVQTLRSALQVGIREVIPANEASALVEAASRSREISSRLGDLALVAKAHGPIILVFAAKGGCGKTTVATNLAMALAQSGKSVCLVDFDLEFGDVAVAMRLDPVKTISDAVPMQATLDAQALSSLVVSRGDNLDILLAPRLPADSDFITPELSERTLKILSEQYEYVVVDSPPAFTDVILKTFDIADEYVLITTLDMPAVKNLQVTMNTLETLGYSREKSHIIVNRSTTKAGLSVEDVEEIIGTKVVASIPTSTAVSLSVNNGRTMMEQEPRSHFANSIRGLATTLTGEPKARRRFRFSLRRSR